MNTLNPSIKHHTVIGALLALWCFLFAFFVRPFEHGSMDFSKWMYVSVGFSVLVFFCYTLVSLLQIQLYRYFKKWSVLLEITIYVFFYVLYSISTFVYYKSDFVAGYYNVIDFLLNIIINIVLILTPLLFFVRKYALKLIPKEDNVITITGENKLDVLKITQEDLVCISNAQNYVEIFYLDNVELRSKLMRSTLKKMQKEYDFLLQIHRSHLINPLHFKSWKDGQTIIVTQKELPVSKSYKSLLLAL